VSVIVQHSHLALPLIESGAAAWPRSLFSAQARLEPLTGAPLARRPQAASSELIRSAKIDLQIVRSSVLVTR
jgi:hypothetical protein